MSYHNSEILQIKIIPYLNGKLSLYPVRRVERSETHRCQFSDPPGPVGSVS